MHQSITSDESDEESLTRTWRAAGIDLKQLKIDDGGTLTPANWGQKSAATLRDATPPNMSALPPGDAPLGFDLTGSEKLDLGEVIGEGGSGVVYLARQPALARDVAIKVITREEDDAALAWLLKEAQVTGALEHPNIVPIHDIGRHADGRPMIVMKRIEGRGWDDILVEDRKELDAGDLDLGTFLDKHLRILVQVSRAVHFGHAKGILHRDLKPENVMLGPFAEVYLVDWDIAATFEGNLVPSLPRTADIDDLFGTPGYMAPEMVSCAAKDFGPRTDVYLLGATLAEVLSGQPPHRTEELVTSLTSSYKSVSPTFHIAVDQPIIDVCHRALARWPVDRTESAEQFAREVEDYLRHRHSLTLSAQGQEKLLALEVLLESSKRAPRKTDDESIAQIYRECRFLFQQARNIWPENEQAYDGFGRATEQVVQHELARERPDAARALLDDLKDKDPELLATVDKALARKREGDAALQSIARDRDVSVGQKARAIGAALLSLGSVTLNVVCGLMVLNGTEVSHLGYGFAHLANLAWGGVIVLGLRGPLLSTVANRQITMTSLLTIASYIGVMGLGYGLHLPFNATLVLMIFVFGVIWLLGTLAFDRRMASLPIIALLEMPLLHLFPAFAFWILAASIGLGLVLTAIILTWSDAKAKLTPN